MKTDFKKFIIIWLILFVSIELIMNMLGFNKKPSEPNEVLKNTVLISTNSHEYTIGKEITYSINNSTDGQIEIAQCIKTKETTDTTCSLKPAADVFIYKEGVWEKQEIVRTMPIKDYGPIVINSGETSRLSLLPFIGDSLNQIGRYKLELRLNEKTYSSPEFQIVEKGWLKKSWDTLFHKPIYNTLVFFIDINPYHSLGLGIILLTILIRIILIAPSQKALRSQKRMQEIQPKIKAIQEKHKGNQERIAMETMAIWKKSNVSPFGSCLPLLLQFPVLIALYYAVREVVLGGSLHNLYSFQSTFDFNSVETIFIGTLNLAEKNIIVLPIIIGLLQYFQMKMSFAKVKQPSTQVADGVDMQQVNKIMLYTMPLMIAFFTATLPAGIGLYWGTSTLFGIAQTYFINKEKSSDSISTNSSEVTVKVIEKSEEEKKNDERDKYLPNKKN